MKHLSFARTGTARKRLISLALIVATLLTALVVIPISFSTKVEAAALGGNAAGAFATPDTDMNTSTVFYASQWASHIATFGGGTDGLFGKYSQTNKANNGTENFYHNNTSCFIFRYQAESGKAPDPYVYWYGSSSHVWGSGTETQLSADEYQYITITYAVYNGGGDSDKVDNLSMAIYPLTVDKANPGAIPRQKVQIQAPVNDPGDGKRIFHTAVFDLTQVEGWSGKIHGFRFDYFDGNSKTDANGNDSSAYEKMVMFVDSFGFFKTMDEVEYHVRERDWVRNGPVREYADDYNDRNVFTAVSRSMAGYFHSPSEILGPLYSREERAYAIFKPTNNSDPKVMFSIDGSDGTNKYDRSLPTSYKYVAISAKCYIPSEPTASQINIGTMQVFLYTASGGGSLSDAMSVKIEPGNIATDQYHTFVFDLSSIVGNVDKIYGIRLDFTDSAQETGMFIDSIGFFETREEAEAMGRAAAYLVKGSALYGALDNEHNINVRKSTQVDALVFECKNTCGDAESATAPIGAGGQGLSCGHLKYEYNQVRKTTQDVVIDPRVKLLFRDEGKVGTKDYKYLVVTYQLPTSDKNPFEGLCPAHNCQVCDPNNEKVEACFNDVSSGVDKNNGHVPLAFHPCVPWPDNSIHEHSNFRIWQKLTATDYDVWVTCVLELTDQLVSQSDLYKTLRGMRVDLFDSHIAKLDAYIFINEIKLVSTKAEAYEGVTSKASNTYHINVSTENNLGGTSSFQSVTPVKNTQTWGSKTDDTAFDMTLTAAKLEDMQLLRDHYDFAGWKAYYTNADGVPVDIPMTDGQFNISVSSDVYTKKTTRTEYLPDSVQTLYDYALEVTMVAQWRLSTGLLTIQPPNTATDEACIYKITGEAMDSGAYTFASLLVSGASDGLSNGSVSVRLPDGTYTVEMLTDWGWRYVGASGLMSEELTVYGAGTITTDASGNSSKGSGQNLTQSFGSVNMTNPHWLDGYGYGRGYGHATP